MTDPVTLPYWLLIAGAFVLLEIVAVVAWHLGRWQCDGEWREKWRGWCASKEAEIQQDFREAYGLAPLRVVEGSKQDPAA